MVGPALFTVIFAAFIHALPGAPFLLAAGFMIIAAAIAWVVTRSGP